MFCMFDFLDVLYVVLRATYDPIIIKSCQMIHIHMKRVHVEFQRGNNIFKPIIIATPIFLRTYYGPTGNYGPTLKNMVI